MILEIINETEDGSAPDTEDLVGWADEFGLTMPVLADPGSTMLYKYAEGQSSIGLPFTVVIDRGVVIDSIGSGSQISRAQELL